MPPTVSGLIGRPRKDDKEYGADHPNGNCHVLRSSGRVPHGGNNGRNEIGDRAGAEVHDEQNDEEVSPRVSQGRLDGLPVRELHAVSGRAGIAIVDHADDSQLALCQAESLCRLGEVEQDELHEKGEEDGAAAFDEVKPSPSTDPSHPLHIPRDCAS